MLYDAFMTPPPYACIALAWRLWMLQTITKRRQCDHGSQSEISPKERKRNKPAAGMLTCLVLWSFNYYKETSEFNKVQLFVYGS